MDLSTIGHRDLDYCSPVSREFVSDLVEVVNLSAAARCADYGCGKGQLLIDILTAYPGATGDGYDANPDLIREAAARAGRSAIDHLVRFQLRVIDDIAHDEPVHLAICFGSTHIFGGFTKAARTLANILKPGGKVLLADGYWKCKPSGRFLKEFFNSNEDDILYLDQMLVALDKAGLSAPYIRSSSSSEWERYEARWAHSLELAAEECGDPDVAGEMRRRAKKSRNNYWLHGGRETLGFAAIVAAKTSRA